MNRLPQLIAVVWSCSVLAMMGQENWSQFRGPLGNGLTLSRRLPLAWSETSNVVWKVEVPGLGWSSPVVSSNQVWLTAASPTHQQLTVVCFDRLTGKIRLQKELFPLPKSEAGETPAAFAAATPALEEGHLYASFGSSGVACLDVTTGAVIWQRTDLTCQQPRGSFSSPVLFLDRLFLQFDGSDRQFVVALDRKTGKTLWQTTRSVAYQAGTAEGRPNGSNDFKLAYSTPLVVLSGTQFSLMSLGAQAFYSYDTATGHELWRVEDPGGYGGWTRPIAGSGLVFTATGGGRGEFWAIRTGGSNVVTETHLAWKQRKNVPHHASPLMVGNLLFLLEDTGLLSCVEAKLGNLVWREQLPGTYSASPIAGGGKLYVFNEEGTGTVVEIGRKFKVLGQNQLAPGMRASPAAYGRSLFLRSAQHLYRVEEKEPQPVKGF
ncbi:MAG: PQQ-binding-like beta-propeller repeat protein [Verrucomicrobiales bacterium]|nr:PQQ-binding-like beta-propeller repeat protein [Verrucomicrobiales bacterium]